MSGMLGIFNTDDAPAAHGELLWSGGAVGFGGRVVHHPPTGCVITADVRLDNREELIANLGLADRGNDLSDSDLVLEAYLAWGDRCAEKLLGDFAFAIWDPRTRSVCCARDQFGMRPFYYHHAPGRRLVFASEPRAILVLPQVPYRINEGRIADYLIPPLEWIDYTSTFFEGVLRLPPAHILIASANGVTTRPYSTLEPPAELRLPSDEAYAEAMRDVLSVAVRARLRGPAPVGSMLSGGLDSGSVVAVASAALRASGAGPLPTFSGVGPDPATCVETKTIHAATTMAGLKPTLVDVTALETLAPQLEDLVWGMDEPFDWMALPQAMYLAARQQGIHVLLDGAAGDVVLSPGGYVRRLFQQGSWFQAWREQRRTARFFGRSPSVAGSARAAASALVPERVRQLDPRQRAERRMVAWMQESIISPEFARRIALEDRIRQLDVTFERGVESTSREAHAAAILPNLTAGRERYHRVARAVGVEPRDPYLDRRVVEFCLSLPDAQRLQDGWPKVILRRAMAGLLPDEVRWRRGKEHLGWDFNLAVLRPRARRMWQEAGGDLKPLDPFVDTAALRDAGQSYYDLGDRAYETKVLSALVLKAWLDRSQRRPSETQGAL